MIGPIKVKIDTTEFNKAIEDIAEFARSTPLEKIPAGFRGMIENLSLGRFEDDFLELCDHPTSTASGLVVKARVAGDLKLLTTAVRTNKFDFEIGHDASFEKKDLV
tara:strand:- start:656 stop:973 length:318 start_codon:yes stop_codon:yes gene_type:complete